MPEFIHTFQSGRMNKDLDERLIPNGEYRDALNLDLANSDGSNVGTLQNVKGNREQRGCEGCSENWSSDYIDALQNPVVIGSYRHDQTERIYWFIASDNVSAIAEYDQTTDLVKPVLVDTAGILNFSQNYLITGINILDKFLFWTDDQTEPKKINIEKFKTGSVDFTTHTKVPKWLPEQNTYQTSLTGQPDFVEDDITTIKKSPLNAPTLFMGASEFDNPNQEPQPGTGITPVTTTWNYLNLENFTYQPNVIINADAFESLPTYAQYLDLIEENPNHFENSSLNIANSAPYPNSDPTYYWDGRITFEVSEVPGSAWIEGESLLTLTGELINDFGPNSEYEISVKIHQINGLTITAEIQAISLDISKKLDDQGDYDPIVWEVLLQEKKPMFEYVFPRFAYRWKYIDGEYSTFSPFSTVAFLGNDFEYVSSDGYNIGMTNNIRKLIIQSLVWSDPEISEVDILYKESNSTAVYVVDTLKKSEYQNVTIPTEYEIRTELIGAAVEPNQILRPWDNVPRKAKSQEIIGNRVVYANYLQNYDTVGVINSSTGEVSTKVDITASLSATTYPDALEDEDGNVISTTLPYSSLKSIRTYQVGLVYKDEYGRETPVFTSKNAGLQLEIANSDTLNKIVAKPNNIPPAWATHYKFFIKETSNEYYNLALDRYYLAEDGNAWLSFPSSERNKVDEETYLILKKQHDNNVAVDELHRYKILAIENEAPEFISTFDSFVTSRSVTSQNEIEPGRITLEFSTGSDPGDTFRNAISSSDSKITITFQGVTSNKYDVSGATISSNNSSFDVTLEKPLGNEIQVIPNGTSNITISIYKQEVKKLPEFEGRFFVKINRNFAFDTNIIESFEAQQRSYAVKDEIDFKQCVVSGTGASSISQILFPDTAKSIDGWYYADKGHTKTDMDCSDHRNRYTLTSWPNMHNPPYGTRMDWEKSKDAKPPSNLEDVFQIIYIGRQPNSFIGNVGGHVGNRFEVSSPNGSLNVGVKIRFANNAIDAEFSEKYSDVYTIIEAEMRSTPRGGSPWEGSNGGCQEYYDKNWDWKNVYVLKLDRPIQETWMPDRGDWQTLCSTLPSIQIVEEITSEGNKVLTSSNPAIFETEPKEAVDLDLYYEASNALPISNFNNAYTLNWFNCYTYGQGVESNRIRDDFNAPYIDKGPKVSTVLDEPYAQERRGSGFIFSQIYNSTSGVNRLNQFIQALPITKDLNPIYGTIQKLHARDTDLIALCEDKCLRILANKDALYNADGNVNLTGNTAVLGQAVPYVGEFGISKNPESFAQYAFRSYFTDKNRGAVIRLSRDGITNIAEKGMSDFFADNLRVSTKIVGSYDDDKDIYNVTLDNLSQSWRNTLSESQDYQLNPDCNTDTTDPITQTTVSFKESVDGWTSRKSFIQESGLSLNNRYFTFKHGRIWEHGLLDKANNFYGIQYDSAFNVIFNEMPQSVKGFSTLNYTGTQSRRLQYQTQGSSKWYSIAEINFNKIIPNFVEQKQPGWYVNYIKTDLEGGEVKEFEKKEGKYFNYIKGLEQFNDCEFIGEGIGPPVIVECDPQDYILTVTIDEDCSGSGSITPDTLFTGWYHWTYKGSLNGNIVNEPTAQDAKCVIDDFYTLDSGVTVTYSAISVASEDFMYVFTDGINPGTQMYDSNTLQPLTESGTYLYIQSPSGATPDNSALDPNNPMPVPATYSIVIWGNDGIIDSVTQYNTLSTCDVVEPPEEYGWLFVKYISYELPYSNPPTPVITPYSAEPTDTSQEIVCKHKTAVEEFNNSVLPACPNQNTCKSSGSNSVKWRWYGPNQGGTETIQLGTIIRDSNGNPQTFAQAGVYNAGQGPGVGYIPSMTYWSDITTMPDDWHVVITNNSGEVIVFQRINELSNSCP